MIDPDRLDEDEEQEERPNFDKSTKGKILAHCFDHRIVAVNCEYSGSGDSGNVESAEVTYRDGTQDTLDGWSNPLIEYLDELLDEHYGGWYDGSGGAGTIKVDVEAQSITIEHGWYVETTEPADNSPLVV